MAHEIKNISHDDFMEFLLRETKPIEFREYVKENGYDLAQFWENCNRLEYMIWFLQGSEATKRTLIGIVGEFSALVLDKMEDVRSRNAVRACAAYYRGEISKEELKVAAKDAREARPSKSRYTCIHAAAAESAYFAVSHAAYDDFRYTYSFAYAFAANAAQNDIKWSEFSKICEKIVRKYVKIIH